MDEIFIYQELAKHDMTIENTFCDSSEDVNLTLPGSEDFCKVTKEIFELKAAERQTVFGVQTVNNEEKKSTEMVSSAGNEGLLRRQKILTVLEPSNTFANEIELPARKASFPAMNAKEVDLDLDFPVSRRKANSCPDNWVCSLLKDLPSIVEVPEEEGIAIHKSKSKSEGDFFSSKQCKKNLSVPYKAEERPVRPSRRFNSARTFKCVKKTPQPNRKASTCATANWKIRVHKTMIIDDDMDIDACSQSSLSASSWSSSTCSDDASSRFPKINCPGLKKNKPFKVARLSH